MESFVSSNLRESSRTKRLCCIKISSVPDKPFRDPPKPIGIEMPQYWFNQILEYEEEFERRLLVELSEEKIIQNSTIRRNLLELLRFRKETKDWSNIVSLNDAIVNSINFSC
jgi:hypothetical protein